MRSTLYQEIFPEFPRHTQKPDASTQDFNIKYRKMNYKEKTSKINLLFNNASLQLQEKKKSTPYFARNTTTHYSPNWC
jgi:hypothetical protein